MEYNEYYNSFGKDQISTRLEENTRDDTFPNTSNGYSNHKHGVVSHGPMKASMNSRTVDQFNVMNDSFGEYSTQRVSLSDVTVAMLVRDTEILNINNSELQENNYTLSSNIDTSGAHLKHKQETVKSIIPNDQIIWDQHSSLRINGHIHQHDLIAADVSGASERFSKDHLCDEGFIHDSGIKMYEGIHQSGWQKFEPDEDTADYASTNRLKMDNIDLRRPIDNGHIVSSHASKDSKSGENIRVLHIEGKKVEPLNITGTYDLNTFPNFEGSPFSNSKLTSELNMHAETHTSSRKSNTLDSQRPTTNYEAETNDHMLDTISDRGLIISPTSLGRSSVPLSSKNRIGGMSFWNQNSAFSSSFNEIEQPFTSLFSAQTNIGDSSTVRTNLASSRPHSVDSMLIQEVTIYDNTNKQPIKDKGTARAKRKIFAKNSGSSRGSSVPENGSLEEYSHGSSESIQVRDTKMIFRTPSSASLLSDSSLTSSPLNVTSRDSHKKPSIRRSIFPDKKSGFDRMPFDDSMTFDFNYEIHQPIISIGGFMSSNESHSENREDTSTSDNVKPPVETGHSVEQETDSKQETKTAVYKRRWYLLFLFSVSAMLWNAVWSTWGPIAQSAKDVYDWTDGDIAMFIWLGNIPFLITMFPSAYLMDVKGPLLVPEPNDLSPVNNTDSDLSAGNLLSSTNNNTNTTDYNAQKTGIMNILYAECGIALLLLLLVLIYFPSKPPLPPSISASIPREKYKEGLKMLIRNKQFWVCALAFSVPIGVYEAWQVILDVNLADRGISQETAGWLDFYATVGGCVSGLLVSRFADFFTRQMKLFLLVFYMLASVAILWFTLVVFDIIPFDHVSIYAAIIIAGVFLDGGGPLFFELTIEVSYPVGEGVTSGFTQMLCAAAGIVFLSAVQVESLGKEWMNWCFFGCVALAIPLLFFINTTYGRADIDDLEIDLSDDEDASTNIEAIDSNEKTYLFGSSHV